MKQIIPSIIKEFTPDWMQQVREDCIAEKNSRRLFNGFFNPSLPTPWRKIERRPELDTSAVAEVVE